MKLLEKIKASQDSTVKFIIQLDSGQIMELSYIDNDTNKDIICVPTQTSCSMGCRFCHITDIKDKLLCKNISGEDIANGVDLVVGELGLTKNSNKTLLISFMGSGEPLLNVDNVFDSMIDIRENYEDIYYDTVRFGMATCMPNNASTALSKLEQMVTDAGLDLKLHLSLHYTSDDKRKEWMPNSASIMYSVILLDSYRLRTGNQVEVHYAPIEGVNDSKQDKGELAAILCMFDLPVKFLFFNEKPNLEFHRSSMDKVKEFQTELDKYGVKSEYYIPPGLEIGASCGQFIKESYLKYNSK